MNLTIWSIRLGFFFSFCFCVVASITIYHNIFFLIILLRTGRVQRGNVFVKYPEASWEIIVPDLLKRTVQQLSDKFKLIIIFIRFFFFNKKFTKKKIYCLVSLFFRLSNVRYATHVESVRIGVRYKLCKSAMCNANDEERAIQYEALLLYYYVINPIKKHINVR